MSEIKNLDNTSQPTMPDEVKKALDVYIQRVFPCRTKEGEKCDTWGICDNCAESALIEAGAEIACKALSQKNAQLVNALNRIGMLGSSETAYTSEFTEKVTSIVQKVLNKADAHSFDLDYNYKEHAYEDFCQGHEAATARLLGLLEKAVEMADVIACNKWCMGEYTGEGHYKGLDEKQIALKFLTTLANASGEISKVTGKRSPAMENKFREWKVWGVIACEKGSSMYDQADSKYVDAIEKSAIQACEARLESANADIAALKSRMDSYNAEYIKCMIERENEVVEAQSKIVVLTEQVATLTEEIERLNEENKKF